MIRGVWTILVVSILPACGTGTAFLITSPEEVSIQEGLSQVGAGLAGMKRELDKEGAKTGLIVDSVELTFDVGVSTAGQDKLTIKASPTPAIPFANLSGDLQTGADTKANRSNKIVIKLHSVFTKELTDTGKFMISGCVADPSGPWCNSVYNVAPASLQ